MVAAQLWSIPVSNVATIDLSASNNLAGFQGIRYLSGTLTATNINLLNTGASDIGLSGSSFPTVATHLTAGSTGGNVYVSNTGSVELDGGQLGNGATFNLATTVDGGGNGQIVIGGNVFAPSTATGTITLTSNESGAGAGGILWTGGTLTAGAVTLQDKLFGFGTGNIGASTSARIQTAAGNLTVLTEGNVFINNTGAVTLLQSQANTTAGGKTFDLTNTPDSGGNGSITIKGAVQAGTINLTSAETGAGQGGIIQNSGGRLMAVTVNLKDGALGTGTGSIGSGTGPNPLIVSTQKSHRQHRVVMSLSSARSFGSVISIGPSSAGATNTFSVISDPSFGDNSIILAGPIGPCGTIILHAAGAGNFNDIAMVTLTANSVVLASDVLGFSGGGSGANWHFGGTPILTAAASNVAANTTSDVYIQNTGNVSVGASSVGTGHTFSLVEDTSVSGSITLTNNIITNSGTIVLASSGSGGIFGAGFTLVADTVTLSSNSSHHSRWRHRRHQLSHRQYCATAHHCL